MSEHPDAGDQTKQGGTVHSTGSMSWVEHDSPEHVFLPQGASVTRHDFHEYKPTFARLEELERKVAELERKWQEDHETLYILLNQHIADLEANIEKLQAKLELAVLEGPD